MPLNPDASELISRRGDRKIFIETGTADGDGIECALKAGFSEIYSIELNPDLFEKAKNKFSKYDNVHLICGSSDNELPKVLDSIDNSFVLWLDAHWSGGQYIGELMNVYLPKELNSILKYSNKFENSVIIIDDMNHYIEDTSFCLKIEELVNSIKVNGKLEYFKSLYATHLVKE